MVLLVMMMVDFPNPISLPAADAGSVAATNGQKLQELLLRHGWRRQSRAKQQTMKPATARFLRCKDGKSYLAVYRYYQP
jgi:hypothetical protein